MSKSFRNITVFSYPYQRFFLTCKEEIPTLMPRFDFQHLTDFDKMRYYWANMQTFAAHSKIIPLEEFERSCLQLSYALFFNTLHLPYRKGMLGLHYLALAKTILKLQYPGKPAVKSDIKLLFSLRRHDGQAPQDKQNAKLTMSPPHTHTHPVLHKYYYCSL